jgi:hypothetical protein
LLADLIDMEDAEAVFAEVKAIRATMFPNHDCPALENAFDDTVRIFEGRYPGYQACTTRYHDLKHATDTLLAMARLIHGASIAGHHFTSSQVTLGLICALMHDTGYIQSKDDTDGTGAKYVGEDTARSTEFLGAYLTSRGLTGQVFTYHAEILICASLEAEIAEFTFPSPTIKLLCKLLGTADLMGQMADRTYLEKLLVLYQEFREAGVSEYADELDLLKKTRDFYERVRIRLIQKLNGVCDFARHHFRERWSIDKNLYTEAIESNLGYLAYVLENHERNYRNHLRRTLQ